MKKKKKKGRNEKIKVFTHAKHLTKKVGKKREIVKIENKEICIKLKSRS